MVFLCANSHSAELIGEELRIEQSDLNQGEVRVEVIKYLVSQNIAPKAYEIRSLTYSGVTDTWVAYLSKPADLSLQHDGWFELAISDERPSKVSLTGHP